MPKYSRDEVIKGLVSCIIPTYKRSDTLLRAVNSVLNQTYKNIEVIIVDDNEPDDLFSLETQQKVKTINDNRVIYIKQEKHINGAVARNVGIKRARGEFIAFLDDDDEWLPVKIEKQIAILSNDREIDGVSCLYTVYKENLPIRKCQIYTGKDLHLKVIDRSVSVFTTTVVLRTKALDNAGLFDESLLRHQDLQLLLDFLFNYSIFVLNEYLAILHSDSTINHPNVDKMIDIKEQFFEHCKRHLERYDRRTQKDILSAHYFEIILSALRSKRIGVAVHYFLKIGINIRAYKKVLQRWKNR
jgi:glycosyltransferase involved in cell wall biosynthesis